MGKLYQLWKRSPVTSSASQTYSAVTDAMGYCLPSLVKFSLRTDLLLALKLWFVHVQENLESPGILLWHFSGLESPRKRPLGLVRSGKLLNLSKRYEVYGRQ